TRHIQQVCLLWLSDALGEIAAVMSDDDQMASWAEGSGCSDEHPPERVGRQMQIGDDDEVSTGRPWWLDSDVSDLPADSRPVLLRQTHGQLGGALDRSRRVV